MATEPQGRCPICFSPSRMTDVLNYHALFTMLSAISTTTTRRTSEHLVCAPYKTGSSTHPSPRPHPWLSTRSKHRLHEPGILIPIKGNIQDKGPACRRREVRRAGARPLISYWAQIGDFGPARTFIFFPFSFVLNIFSNSNFQNSN
jgi:hypothetical protein